MANWLPQALRSGFTWNVAVMYLRWSEPYRPHCQWHNCDNWAGIEIHWLANFWQFRPHRPVEEQTLKQVLMRCHYNVSLMFLVDTCTEYFNFFCKEIFELHLEAWETIIGRLKSSRKNLQCTIILHTKNVYTTNVNTTNKLQNLM